MWFHSFRRSTERRIWMPQTCSRPGRYRSDVNGIASSIDHPPSKSAVRLSRIGFQSKFGLPSFVICRSDRPPIELP